MPPWGELWATAFENLHKLPQKNPQMTKDPTEILHRLKQLFGEHTPPLAVRKNSEQHMEIAGTKEVMQGKQKVDGHYFASLQAKPKDVRFYFFPIYTHANAFAGLSDEMRKSLKGKSCFHIKKLDDNMEKEIRGMLDEGVRIYQRENLI